MRQLQAQEHGEPLDVLAVVDVDDGPLEPGEVRIAPDAVGLNFLDIARCRGTYGASTEFPLSFGVEVAGHVVEAGHEATHLLGREVVACPALPRGALGDRVVIAARYVIERPADIDPVVAASLPVNYQTAWFALRRAGLQPGSTVLVTAAAGGTGIATVQLAVAAGATVLAAAGGPAKTALCAEQGADITIDYLATDLPAAVRDATGGRGVDVIVDSVGGTQFAALLDALAFEGVMVAIGVTGGPHPPLDPLRLAARNVSVVGLSWGSTYPDRAPAAVAAAYDGLFERCRRGEVRPLISRTVPLDGAPAALASLADRGTVGKLVVTFP
jgi:NADPH2:quinone reductase